MPSCASRNQYRRLFSSFIAKLYRTMHNNSFSSNSDRGKEMAEPVLLPPLRPTPNVPAPSSRFLVDDNEHWDEVSLRGSGGSSRGDVPSRPNDASACEQPPLCPGKVLKTAKWDTATAEDFDENGDYIGSFHGTVYLSGRAQPQDEDRHHISQAAQRPPLPTFVPLSRQRKVSTPMSRQSAMFSSNESLRRKTSARHGGSHEIGIPPNVITRPPPVAPKRKSTRVLARVNTRHEAYHCYDGLPQCSWVFWTIVEDAENAGPPPPLGTVPGVPELTVTTPEGDTFYLRPPESMFRWL